MSSESRHYRLEEWTDFVRDVCPPARKEEMAAHLETGCPECRQACDLLARVSQVGRAALVETEIPANLLRYAKTLVRSPQRPALLPRLLARLVYDSALQPLPAGIRTAATGSRQALFRTGDYCVDIRLERQHESRRLSLVGQVGNETSPNLHIGPASVTLQKGEKTLVETSTNEFGEFQMEFDLRSQLRLLIHLKDRLIELHLGKFSDWKE